MSPKLAGAQFWSVDLHVHTPASGDADVADYGDPQTIVAAAIAAGLDAIAITDHNTYEWCDRIAQAASNTELIVLPGVELSTPQGHLLGIWEEGTHTTVISDFLVSVGIDTANHGDLAVDTEKSFLQCCDEISRRGGVAIAAHVEKEKGILRQVGVAASLKRILSCANLSALEVVSLDTIAELNRRSDVAPSAVRSSDTYSASLSRHSLTAIGQRRTWIKASRPDLVGLRHAFDDPTLRLRLEEPASGSFPYIESVSINGGFLGGQSFPLSPDMTCLLGGTGSGKSLLLEAIRYAMDQQVDRDSFSAIREEVDARLAEALGPAGRVLLAVTGADGKRYRIERVFSSDGTAVPVVRENIGGDFVVTERTPRDIVSLSAFSQGEVLEYSRQRVGRMTLVDHAIDLSHVSSGIEGVVLKIAENSAALVAERQQLEALLEGSSNTQQLKDQVDRLSQFFDDRTIASQNAWTQESIELEKRLSELSEFDFPKPLTLQSVQTLVDDNASLVGQVNTALGALNASLEVAQQAVMAARTTALATVQRCLDEWRMRHDSFVKEVDARLEAVEPGASMPALRRRLSGLQASLAAADASKNRIETEVKPRLDKLVSARQEHMDELFSLRRERRELRRARVRELNSRMKGAVKLDVPDDGDSSDYRSELNELKVGSRLKDSFVDAVAQYVSPARFVRSLLNEDYGALVTVDSSIDAISMAKFHANIVTKGWEHRLLALQSLECPDVLSIKLKKPEDGHFEIIERLSHGQRCTAILVILLADGTSPVLVDQPEDAVHAPWIEDYLVVRLRELRGSRQYLFATRSPGLVVSGDCEQIITLKATAGQGVIEAVGSLERHDLNRLALEHLEGGKVPFSRRTRKFRPSISD